MINVEFIIEDKDIDQTEVKKTVDETFNKLGIRNAKLEIWFSSSSEIGKLNKEHRNIDKPTDVLSFPQITIGKTKKHLGSLVISREIVEQKEENMEDVVKHGILHLLGYDHEEDEQKWDEMANIINCKL